MKISYQMSPSCPLVVQKCLMPAQALSIVVSRVEEREAKQAERSSHLDSIAVQLFVGIFVEFDK